MLGGRSTGRAWPPERRLASLALPTRILSCGALVVLSALTGVLASLLDGSTGVQYACACTILAVAVVVTVWLDWRRTGDVMSVIALVGLFYLLAYVAGSIFLWFNPSFGVTVPVKQPFTHHGLMRAEWLCVLAWIGFAVGYRLRIFGFVGIPRLKLQCGNPPIQGRAMLWLYSVGWIARVAGIPRGLYFHNLPSTNIIGTVPISSTTNQILYTLAFLPLVSVAYLGVRAHSDQRFRSYYRLGLIVELAWAVSSGGRGNVVNTLLLALAVQYYTAGRFPLKPTLLAMLFTLFFVFPVLALYRDTSQKTHGYQVSNLSAGVSTYTSTGLGNVLLSGIGSTLGRFNDIIIPAALEDRGRNAYPISDGATLGWAVVNFIPHALDPGKPIVNNLQNALSYELRVTPVKNNYEAITQVAEMYWDFGTLGAAIAFLFVGSLYRELNEWTILRRSGRNPAVLALYAALAYFMMQTDETLIADQLDGFIRTVVVLSLLMWVTTRFFERPERRAQRGMNAVGRSGVPKAIALRPGNPRA
jgi:hypothetical protein